MAKRLHDTGLWIKQWFRILSPAEKCAFLYLLNACDGAGVWDPDFPAAEFIIGDKVNWEELPGKTKNNIEVLDNGKWWVVDFVAFQCGELKETCAPHKSYIALLKKHGLYERVTQGLGNPYPRVKEREEEEEREKELDIELELDKEKDKKDPAVKRLVDNYYDTYVARTKEKPTPSGRWGRAFKTWLRAHSEDEIRKVISYFFGYSKRTQFGFDKFHTAFDNLAPAALGHAQRAGPMGWKCPHCGEVNTHTGSRCMKCRKDRDDPKEGK